MGQQRRVRQNALDTYGEGSFTPGLATRLGLDAVTDFYLYMALVGAAYQVRAGTITTPLVGDVVITDTAAEMAVDALTGTTIIPVYLNVAVRLGTGTLHEYAAKSVTGNSTVGTAFVPLALKTNAPVASATARVSAAGGVTVPAELATTTRRHWAYANPVAVGAGHDQTMLEWEPRVPPILVGPYCFYVQIAATGTGPSYFATAEYLEAPTNTIL